MSRKAVYLGSALALALTLFITCSKDSPVSPKDTNHAPVFSAIPVDTSFGKNMVGQPYTLTLNATDEDGDKLSFSLVSGPAGLTVVDSSGVVTWTPATATNATVTIQVSDGKEGNATVTWKISFLNFIKNTAPLPVLNVNDAFFMFRNPYTDTLWGTTGGLTFSLLLGPESMKVASMDSFAVITWLYPDSHLTAQQIDSIGTLNIKVRVTNGTTSDTLSWMLHINTQPYPLTTQYQMPYANYVGNSYVDTVTVVDDEGDFLTLQIADPSGLGVSSTGTIRMGDTTWYIVQFTADSAGTFPVTITMTDVYGMDTALTWNSKVSPKVMLISKPEFMKAGIGVDSMYTDTVEIFSEYAGTVTFTLLSGPTGMTVNGQGAVSWHPTVADSDSVSIELVRGANLEKDTLTWYVKAVAVTKFVFWYQATTNGYNLQQFNPGPGIPAGATVMEGMVATWNTRLGTSDNDAGFAVGNGLNADGTNPASGRSSMIWANDLCNMMGTATKALVRGELRDGWSGNSFVHDGRLTMKIGVIDLIVYRDLTSALGFNFVIPCDATWKGGAGPLANPWSYDIKFYHKPGNPTVSYPGLMAEQIVTIQAPKGRPSEFDPSVNDGKFFEIDVTPQVQWILDQKGKDYVQTTAAGDYAIVFLVANDATLGGEGKVNLLSDECATGVQIALPGASDQSWSTDGNTMHFYVEGNLVPAP